MHSVRQLHNLALIGFMGTGKTSVGRLVADALRFDFLDTDELIEELTENLRGRTPQFLAALASCWGFKIVIAI